MSTNLPRVTQKIFGENAGQHIGQFGSALAGQGNPTGDIEEIQALPAWEGGWNSAVISERDYPPLEEMTGIQKVETQQIAYLMQKGIPEWDAGTTYFANISFCQIDGLVYRSLTDNNLGNNPATDTTNWEVWKPLEGNYANTDLSNLTSVGIDKINQSKALETGAVSSDADVYADIQKYAHSTFDLSKFEVVGSLNITDDGIASGFGSNNRYIYKDFEDISSSDFTIIIPVKLTQLSSLQFFASAVDSSNTAAFSFRQEGNNIACNWAGIDEAIMSYFYVLSNPQLNTQYYIKVEKKGNVFSVSYRTDNSDWIIAKSATSSNVSNPITRLLLGTSNDLNNSLTYGSIDLKRVSVVVDDIPAFSGNQTGIDTIKPDDYTVVGTPTITDDGIMSQNNQNQAQNYVYSPSTYNLTSGIFKIFAKVKIPVHTDNELICLFAGGSESNNIYLSETGNKWTFRVFGTAVQLPSQLNVWSYLIGECDGKTATLKVSQDLQDWQEATVDVSELDFSSLTSVQVRIGASGIWAENVTKSFDLNETMLYTKGDLVYQPCLKVPYALSKTGSKIVDAAYRDRVQDIYEQYGSAPYYTIDEENQNFTLPMGEIYGMMITKTGDETISGLKTFNNNIIAHNSPSYTDRGVRYLSTQGINNWCQITQAWQVINGEEFKAETLLKVSPEGKPLFVFPKCTEKATTTSSASGENVAVVVQNYVNGTSWYRIWSDGWIQQGGRIQLTSQNTTGSVVSFLKAFQNTNYSVTAMVERYTSSDVGKTDDTTVLIQGLATNNMKLMLWDADNNNYQTYVRWRACGY